MSFLPRFVPKRVYENILRYRTLYTMIRVWVEREKDGPDDQTDYAEIGEFIKDNRPLIDSQGMLATAELVSKAFHRIVAIEVISGSNTNGVIIYPRWT